MAGETNLFLNNVLSMLLRRILVPSDYHEQVRAVKEMQKDDLTGLVDSLTDFAVDCASVDFRIETDNAQFTKILKNWTERVNIGYKGRIPPGIRELAREYFKERWKYSSFPILKISKWEASKEFGGVILPTKMFFVDGESIYAKDRDEKDENLTLLSYDYYLGKNENNLLQDNAIFSRPYGRWFDEYPTPYLVKRGVYHNWRIIKSLKEMQTKILDQVIPYILLIKKGTAQLANQQVKTYSNPELQSVLDELKSLKKEMEKHPGDTPARATNFDEEIKHLIPDLSTIFDVKLFAQAERGILSGLGFVDVIQGISDTRRESILNPKVFVEEVNNGVEDFKNHVLKPLIFMIQEKNRKHKKYMNVEFYVCSSPIAVFQTDDFKNQMRMLWERGQLSNQTYAEVVGEVEYRTERARRQKEAKDGDEYTMYPHIRENREGVGIDIPGEEPIDKDTDKNGKPIPTDKIDDKEKFDVGITELITAPYNKVAELPDSVKKKLTPAKQRAWMKIFNNAYRFYMKKFGDAKKAESLAFRTAWSQIKQVKSKKKSKKKVSKKKK